MWKTVKLGDIADVQAGNPAPQDKIFFENGVYPFVRTSDVGKVKVGSLSDANDKLNQQGIAKLKLFPKGTILFPKSGASTFLNHRVILEMDAYVASHLATIKSKQDYISDKYLWYFLQTIDAANLVADSSYPSLNTKTIQSISVPLPPLVEQERIVAKLNAAFAEIDKAVERVNQQLLESEALYKTSLTRCFNNDSVTRKPLSEICKITSSKRVMKKDYVDNGVPFYRTKEIKQLANGEPVTTELFISKEMFDSLRHKFGAPKEGEILITAIGTIGEVYIVREDDEFYFKDGNVLWLKEISEVSQEYLRYGLLSFVEQLNSLAHGAAYSALPIQRLKAFELPIPPIHQQLEIVKRLKESFALIATFINSLSSKRKSLDILKSAILSKELQPPQSEAA